MVLPLPGNAPLTLEELCTNHEYVVPETALGFEIAMEVEDPEHMVSPDAAAFGIGFTVTT